jgi:hypothetical protein
MKTATQQGPRPPLVNLALIISLVGFGVSLGPRFAHAALTNFSECVACAAELIILLPLWFIFRGKSWARLVLLALTFLGFCFRLPQLIQQFEAHSLGWTVAYILGDAVVLVLLFLPSSNRWFQGSRNAIAA